MKQNTYKSFSFFLLLGLVLSLSSPAYAHKVNVFAYGENGQIYIEGYFADGKKAQNSAVTVYDAADAEVLNGLTDIDGLLELPIPANVTSDLRIVLNAGMGHQGQYTIPANEFVSVEETHVANKQGVTIESKSIEAALQQQTGVANVNQAEINVAVKKAVSEAIKPLVRELAASREHATMTQITGGIGYILGLLGLFAYMKARQEMAKGKA